MPKPKFSFKTNLKLKTVLLSNSYCKLVFTFDDYYYE